MNTLYWLVTITDRHSTDAFLALYEEHGITVSLRTVGAGTAVRETLSTLGLEKTEKAVLLAVVTAQTWQEVQRDLRRKMRIDVPGTGIAFTVPLSSIGGRRALMFLTQHQPLTLKEESTLKDTRYELLLVIANQGHTGTIMDAARAAGLLANAAVLQRNLLVQLAHGVLTHADVREDEVDAGEGLLGVGGVGEVELRCVLLEVDLAGLGNDLLALGVVVVEDDLASGFR